jgi:hypothetical protein
MCSFKSEDLGRSLTFKRTGKPLDQKDSGHRPYTRQALAFGPQCEVLLHRGKEVRSFGAFGTGGRNASC